MLADLYEVGIRELIDGERKNGNMDTETKETVLKVAEYMNMETERYTKRVRLLLWTGAFLWLAASLIRHTDLDHNAVFNAVANFAEGAAIGMIFCGIVFTSRYGQRIRAFKRRLLKNP